MDLHLLDHVFERIFGICRFAVGVDAHEHRAVVLKFFRGLPRLFIRAYDVGAMVAGEKDHERLGSSKVFQGIHFPVSGGKREIRRGSAIV